MKNGTILKENTTHKAVVKNGRIAIYLKGLNEDEFKGDEDEQWFKTNYPHWFKDELIDTIPLKDHDDLLPMFDGFEEESRILLAEAREEFKDLSK